MRGCGNWGNLDWLGWRSPSSFLKYEFLEVLGEGGLLGGLGIVVSIIQLG